MQVATRLPGRNSVKEMVSMLGRTDDDGSYVRERAERERDRGEGQGADAYSSFQTLLHYFFCLPLLAKTIQFRLSQCIVVL